jgi:hypothetical protein
MGDVIRPTFITVNFIDPGIVCEAARDHKLDEVIIIGVKNGEPYYASSTGDSGKMLLMIEKWKHDLIAADCAD